MSIGSPPRNHRRPEQAGPGQARASAGRRRPPCPEDRRGLRRIYAEIADRYELVNHLLTFGLDLRWRRQAASWAARAGGRNWLDMCTGTGEMVENLARLAPAGVHLVAADVSPAMLARVRRKRGLARVSLALAEGARLPFRDGAFDLVTISFATRNLNSGPGRLLAALEEFQRVLRPGGRLVNLETSQPRSRVLRALLHAYVGVSVRPLGRLFSGSREAYRYLAHTIPRFHDPERLADLLRSAGAERVERHLLFGGVAAVHIAVKGSPAPGKEEGR